MKTSIISANSIKTDYRLELLSTAIYLSYLDEKSFVVSQSDLGSSAINERFADFVNHPAVTEYPRLWELGLWWGEVPRLALFLTDDIHLMEEYKLEDGFYKIIENAFDTLIEYVAHLRDFDLKSNFPDYYKTTLQENMEFRKILNDSITNHPYNEILEDYTGLKFDNTHIVLMNILKCSIGVWTGSSVNRNIYSFCGSYWLQVAQGNKSLERVLFSIIWHEFLHSVINPLSDNLFPDGLVTTEEQSVWYCALNESIIWAITHRLCVQNDIVKSSDNAWYFENALRNKAPKTEAMYNLLLQYEADRKSFNTIADFYPQLQKEFGQPPD